MQLFAKFQKILRREFRATLNFRKFIIIIITTIIVVFVIFTSLPLLLVFMANDNDDAVRCSLCFVISRKISKLWTYILHRAGLKYANDRQARVAGGESRTLRTAGATIYCNCTL